MEDQGIIRLLWSRTETALEHLAHRFGRRLYATAMHILGEHRDAEETVNDTYLAVWNAIPPQKPDPLAAFVYKIGRNLALKRLRTNTAQKRRGDYELSLEELEGCIPAPALAEQVGPGSWGGPLDGSWMAAAGKIAGYSSGGTGLVTGSRKSPPTWG